MLVSLADVGSSGEKTGLDEGIFTFENVKFTMHAKGLSRDAHLEFRNVDVDLRLKKNSKLEKTKENGSYRFKSNW